MKGTLEGLPIRVESFAGERLFLTLFPRAEDPPDAVIGLVLVLGMHPNVAGIVVLHGSR